MKSTGNVLRTFGRHELTLPVEGNWGSPLSLSESEVDAQDEARPIETRVTDRARPTKRQWSATWALSPGTGDTPLAALQQLQQSTLAFTDALGAEIARQEAAAKAR